jgi:hypothetical protein
MFKIESIARNLDLGILDNLPRDVIELTDTMREAARTAPEQFSVANFAQGGFASNDGLLGGPLFLAALISARAHSKSPFDMIESWRRCLATVPHQENWDTWLTHVETVLGLESGHAGAMARDHTGTWLDTMAGALNLLLSDIASPEDLFLAQARWLSNISTSPWLRQTAPVFCQLLERRWLSAVATPALFRYPKFNVPQIEQACRDGSSSLSKALRIFEVTLPAMSTRLSDAMLKSIRDLDKT